MYPWGFGASYGMQFQGSYTEQGNTYVYLPAGDQGGGLSLPLILQWEHASCGTALSRPHQSS